MSGADLRERLLAFALLAVGLLHLYPALGALGVARLAALYEVPLADAGLVLLLRHRAVLFGLLGVLLLLAAWRSRWRDAATAVALVSMLSFVVLAWPVEAQRAALARVFWADLVGSVLLAAAWGAARVGR